MELDRYKGLQLRIDPYPKEDLERVTLAHAHTAGLELSSEEISSIVTNTGLPSRPGTRIEDPYRQDVMASRQPAAVIASVDFLVENRPAPLTAETIATELRARLSPTVQVFSHAPEVAFQSNTERELRATVMAMSGREFESFVCSLLKDLGYQVAWSSPGKDGGIDITAFSKDPLHGGKFLFQCKRYQESSTVGRPTLQAFVGAAHNDKQHPRLVFITTSSFTREAQQYGAQIGMRLIDLATLKGLTERLEQS